MAWASKVSSLTRRYVEERGLHIAGVCQPQHLFDKSADRRLPRVALPCDPWQASISTERFMGAVSYGIGRTPDEAVLRAMPRDIRSAMARLEAAVDSLRDCLQK
jgi:hypothetical protein